MSMSGIYKITNLVNGKIYIGSAKDIPNRWRVHKSDLSLQKHGSITLQRSWNLHGEKAFKFEFIEHVANITKLVEREQHWLDLLKPYDLNIGYNILKIAGSRLGSKHTEEFKAKRSALYKGRKQSLDIVAKRVASNTGKKRTEETKAKMSAWQKGSKLSDSHKENLSKSHMGHKQSEETKLKIKEFQVQKQFDKYKQFDSMITNIIEIRK